MTSTLTRTGHLRSVSARWILSFPSLFPFRVFIVCWFITPPAIQRAGGTEPNAGSVLIGRIISHYRDYGMSADAPFEQLRSRPGCSDGHSGSSRSPCSEIVRDALKNT